MRAHRKRKRKLNSSLVNHWWSRLGELHVPINSRESGMIPIIAAMFLAELLTFFVLWHQGFWIALAGAVLSGALAGVGAGIVLALRVEPRVEKTSGVGNRADFQSS